MSADSGRVDAGTMSEQATVAGRRVETPNGARALLVFSLPFCAAGLYLAGELLAALGSGEASAGALVVRAAMALTFGGAGFGMLAFARHASRQAEEQRTLRERHPDEPWRWRREWAEGRIVSQDGATALLACTFAAFWNLLCAPLYFERPDHLPFFVWAFPAVGLALAAWAAHASWRRRRFGRSHFAPNDLPGVVGRGLRGTVHVPADVRPETGFQVRLSCIHRATTGSGKQRSTRENVLWQEQRTVPTGLAPATPQGTAIPVDFSIPLDASPTGERSASDEVLWRLETLAEVPGVDLHAVFEVPVFRTADTPKADEAAPTVEPIGALTSEPTPLGEDARVRVSRLPDGAVELYFPAPRSLRMAVLLTFSAVFWNGLVWGMGAVSPTPIRLFLAIFALVGVLLLLLAVDAWVGTRRIRVRPGELRVTRKWLGIGRTRVHGPDGLSGLSVEANGHVGSQVFHAVKGRRPGRKLAATLADGFFDRQAAERVRDLLQRGLDGQAV